MNSGASAHMTPNKAHLSNLQTVNVRVTLADGSRVDSTQCCTLKLKVFDKLDKPHILWLTDVLYVPSLSMTLFSVPSFLRHPGNTVSFFRDRIELTAGGLHISLPASNFKEPMADKWHNGVATFASHGTDMNSINTINSHITTTLTEPSICCTATSSSITTPIAPFIWSIYKTILIYIQRSHRQG